MRIGLRTLPVVDYEGDQIGSPAKADIDIRSLQRDLEKTVRGEIRFDSGSRGIYAHDASNYRMVPIGVTIPKDEDDVVAIMAAARKHNAPILSRGGGTAIPGQGVNTALIIDYSKYMNQVISVDPDAKIAVIQPGCIPDTLNAMTRRFGLIFGPDPATHSRNTIGGMIGNNSCGIHSVLAGRTSDNIEALEILLYDGTRLKVGATSDDERVRIIAKGGREGEIYRKLTELRDEYADEIRARYPKIPRRVSGFNLDNLLPESDFNVARALVGSEGTCVTVLKAWCNLIPDPKFRSLVAVGCQDVVHAARLVPEALTYKPIGCEGLDDVFMQDLKKKDMHPPHLELLPKGNAWLFVEFGGESKEDADEKACKLVEEMQQKHQATEIKLLDNPEFEADIWHIREEGLGATAQIPGEKENHEGWEDTAVHPDQVGEYLADFRALMDKYGYRGSLYGHFGDGCIHVRLDFDLKTEGGIQHYRKFVQEGAELVVRYNGSLSGEHGDGQARGELLTRMFGPELIQAFAKFKQIWDPDWRMNPGKVIAPYRIDENFTHGTDYNPPEIQTHFQFPADNYSFGKAADRCVGAGVCRRLQGGTMCPSFMVTREEKHSTRGRARMLFEMVKRDPVEGGWASKEVKDALDLCLSCKGCKGDCPVQVDMASYKAEFLSHYYEKKRRPRTAFAFGQIQVWAKFASFAPGFVNLVSHFPILNRIAKQLTSIAPQRTIPKFAPYTFRSWLNRRRRRRTEGPKVILWADTFNNHFHPTTAQAAVEVLEHCGFQVEVPRQHLCCGRPLYDYGFLDQAKAYLQTILEALRPQIREGLPIVVLEPSCCSVFRDELINLFPHDQDALRLSEQTFLLSEFLEKETPNFSYPKLHRKAILHGHCHHKALMKLDAEKSILQKMELDVDAPDSGCCGMAGAFGFEKGEHYEVSIKCGERVLLPAVRDAEPDTLIIADGFSCREQVSQTTDRVPLHLAQVIQMAIKEGQYGTPGRFPERDYVTPPRSQTDDLKTVVIAGACLYGFYRLGKYLVKKAQR